MVLAVKPHLAPGTALTDRAVLANLWLGRGQPPAEVIEVAAQKWLTDGELRRCWQARAGGRGVPLLAFQARDGDIAICGPDGDRPPVVVLPEPAAVLVLRQFLAAQANEVVAGYLTSLARALGTGGVPGFRNQHFLSTHYLIRALRRNEPAVWAEWSARPRHLRGSTGDELWRRLGFSPQSIGLGRRILDVQGQTVAVAHHYPAHQNLDRIVRTPGFPAEGVQAAAVALREARHRGVEYAFLLAGPVLRLHRVSPGEEFEEGAATAAFLELDLELLPDHYLAVLWACCSAEALWSRGHLSRLFVEAGRYAVGLRDRFRDRVYGEVVPGLISGLWEAARAGLRGDLDPDVVYRGTLLLLFRILFVLYAEDRNLLPLRRTSYRLRSITQRVDQVLETLKRGPQAFDPRQTDIWEDLTRVFAAVREGHREWGIPPYDGGLFEDEVSDEARLLAGVKLPNPIIGHALYLLAVDELGTERGKVDFGDLGVRHLGTIYEGLLSYRALIADRDLAVDTSRPEQSYRPAGAGDEVSVRAGMPYLVSPEGGRKATGSYYTPTFVVDRLVAGALAPVLEAHYDRVDGLPDAQAASCLFDIKVCDPAMGSGHFLTRALDYIAESFQSYLAKRPLGAVTTELERARERLGAVGKQYGAPAMGEEVSDFDLLRRLVLKRCIYGVDLNPMAVELARLSLWLRSFVPGLPLSYLGHTLRTGNSLVGAAGAEAPTGLAREFPLMEAHLAHVLAAAESKAAALGCVDDLELHEVAHSERLQREIEDTAAPARALFDAFTAQGFGPFGDWQVILRVLGEAEPGKEVRLPPEAMRAIAEVRHAWNPLHWPLAFPEVFLREPPGFDAVVGNPPWEEVTVEEVGFFVRYVPGLKSERSAEARARRIEEYCADHGEVVADYRQAQRSTADLRLYLRHKFELTQSGDPDLYRAFCERFLQILRPGGSLAVVLPRTAFSGDGTAPFRERLFERGAHLRLDFLLNNSGWVFPDVHPQYTLALSVRIPAHDPTSFMLSCATPAKNRVAFDRLDEDRVEWTKEELIRLSEGLEVPLMPSRRAADLFKRLADGHPRFDSADGGFQPVPWAELHATKDRKSGLLRESGDGWPVYTGESFDLWQPDLTPPVQVVRPDEGLAELQRKRERSRVWREYYPDRVLRDPLTLPQHGCRILFRDVTNRTNSRTIIACLVPPKLFASNQAPSLLFPTGDLYDQIYVLGMMCSVPFDWLARRRVETHVNFFILKSLPMPRPPRESSLRRRIVKVAGRLACPDERFAEVARAVGVPHGPLELAEKSDLIAELDALAARAYGVAEEDLVLMFDDFPATEAGLSEERRALIVSHFRSLGGALEGAG